MTAIEFIIQLIFCSIGAVVGSLIGMRIAEYIVYPGLRAERKEEKEMREDEYQKALSYIRYNCPVCCSSILNRFGVSLVEDKMGRF